MSKIIKVIVFQSHVIMESTSKNNSQIPRYIIAEKSQPFVTPTSAMNVALYISVRKL